MAIKQTSGTPIERIESSLKRLRKAHEEQMDYISHIEMCLDEAKQEAIQATALAKLAEAAQGYAEATLEVKAPMGRFVEVQFPGERRTWTYDRQGRDARVGDKVTAAKGVFAGQWGEVVDVHDCYPAAPYCHQIGPIINTWNRR